MLLYLLTVRKENIFLSQELNKMDKYKVIFNLVAKMLRIF